MIRQLRALSVCCAVVFGALVVYAIGQTELGPPCLFLVVLLMWIDCMPRPKHPNRRDDLNG